MIEKLILQECTEYPYIDINGVSHKSKKGYLQSEILHFCGCGDPDTVMIYVRDFLQKLQNQDWEQDEDLSYMFLCHWANYENFAEHGSTIKYSWLTDKGKELLGDINWCLEYEKTI